MNIVMRFVLFLVISCTVLTTGCMRKNCLKDISISRSYIVNIDGMRKYCKSFESACSQDFEAFNYLLNLDFYDGLTYEHGYVLSIIIDSLGEEVIITWVNDFELDLDRLKTYLKPGQDWRNAERDYEDWYLAEEEYPLIFAE